MEKGKEQGTGEKGEELVQHTLLIPCAGTEPLPEKFHRGHNQTGNSNSSLKTSAGDRVRSQIPSGFVRQIPQSLASSTDSNDPAGPCAAERGCARGICPVWELSLNPLGCSSGASNHLMQTCVILASHCSCCPGPHPGYAGALTPFC